MSTSIRLHCQASLSLQQAVGRGREEPWQDPGTPLALRAVCLSSGHHKPHLKAIISARTGGANIFGTTLST
ncbi:hypothetical protein Q5P01_003458 [Channa striata]|uniref:Uncharacterized protein n=1 Tax=Channa striata TaxID=64152 RepID=A0AA88T0B8_CHASR|nr:hypothetical protein Q5P01_003458 [Channa striata]